MTLHSNAYRDLPRIKPNDNPCAMGIFAGPDQDAKQLGIAYPRSHVGGCRAIDPVGADYTPPEVTWRLVFDREVVGGVAARLEHKRDLGDRWVLRLGVFVELAEDAE